MCASENKKCLGAKIDVFWNWITLGQKYTFLETKLLGDKNYARPKRFAILKIFLSQNLPPGGIVSIWRKYTHVYT